MCLFIVHLTALSVVQPVWCRKVKVKGQIVPVYTMKACAGAEVLLCSFLISALGGGEEPTPVFRCYPSIHMKGLTVAAMNLRIAHVLAWPFYRIYDTG